MSRPRSTIVERHTDRNFKVTEIVTRSSLFILLYKGQPVQMRYGSMASNWKGSNSYHRTTWPNRAHAVRCAAKLNKMFHCDHFTIMEWKPS